MLHLPISQRQLIQTALRHTKFSLIETAVQGVHIKDWLGSTTNKDQDRGESFVVSNTLTGLIVDAVFSSSLFKWLKFLRSFSYKSWSHITYSMNSLKHHSALWFCQLEWSREFYFTCPWNEVSVSSIDLLEIRSRITKIIQIAAENYTTHCTEKHIPNINHGFPRNSTKIRVGELGFFFQARKYLSHANLYTFYISHVRYNLKYFSNIIGDVQKKVIKLIGSLSSILLPFVHYLL